MGTWVGTWLEYVPGSSLPTDGAVRTLLSRKGVCRDYAHLCVALLRASGVPAPLVSVYAPGLGPMDFHAVCEAFVEGMWCVVDATVLTPRASLVRIATGRDAADTAFMTVISGHAELRVLVVGAVADTLPDDDLTAATQLCRGSCRPRGDFHARGRTDPPDRATRFARVGHGISADVSLR